MEVRNMTLHFNEDDFQVIEPDVIRYNDSENIIIGTNSSITQTSDLFGEVWMSRNKIIKQK